LSEESIKEEIVRLIDENPDQWIKAAFYSDERVKHIMANLYERWERDDSRMLPIDYATLDELKQLYALAKKYSRLDTGTAMRIALGSELLTPVQKRESIVDKIIKVLKKLIFPTKPRL